MTRLPGSAGHVPLDDVTDEQPVDVPRLLAALRRAWWLIALIVVPLTGAVLVLSLVLPKTYEGTTRLVLQNDATALGDAGGETVDRRLATIQTLVTSRDILRAASEQLDGETLKTLEDKVTASVDGTASIVDIRAVDNDPDGAAEIANTVADTFLTEQRGAERRRFVQTRRELQAALDRLEGRPGSDVEVAGLRQRLSELSIAEVAATDELELAEAATAPERQSSPLPLQNTLLAFFAATFLAVLAVLGREAVIPRLTGPRELTKLTGLLPLVVLPRTRWRRRQRQAADAFQSLAASVRLQLSDSQRVVVVTSAHRGEGRSTVAEGLATALAEGGVPTLLVAADLRRPTLHERMGAPQAPGLAEVLNALEHDAGNDAADVIRSAVHEPRPEPLGTLRVLPSGNPSRHPASLLSGSGLAMLFDGLAHSRYRFVIVEGAPLIGPIDGQLIARAADAVLVVCRLDRLSPAEATELGDVLTLVETPALGAVVIGAAAARYSLGASPPATRDEAIVGRP